MTLYEQHIGRLTTKADLPAEVEFYVSRILTKEQMEKRKKFLSHNKKPKQLTLF